MGRPKAKYADYAPGVGQSCGRKGRCNVDRRQSFESIFGADLTEDEVEFGKAMSEFVRHNGQPDCREVLQVAKSLGYRKDKSCQSQTP